MPNALTVIVLETLKFPSLPPLCPSLIQIGVTGFFPLDFPASSLLFSFSMCCYLVSFKALSLFKNPFIYLQCSLLFIICPKYLLCFWIPALKSAPDSNKWLSFLLYYRVWVSLPPFSLPLIFYVFSICFLCLSCPWRCIFLSSSCLLCVLPMPTILSGVLIYRLTPLHCYFHCFRIYSDTE